MFVDNESELTIGRVMMFFSKCCVVLFSCVDVAFACVSDDGMIGFFALDDDVWGLVVLGAIIDEVKGVLMGVVVGDIESLVCVQ